MRRASEILNRRITDAKNLLKEQRRVNELRSVNSLSRTAAQLLQVTSTSVAASPTHVLELTMFQTQLEAIRALKSGAVPKPPGETSVDFPAEIAAKEEQLAQQNAETRALMARLSQSLTNFYSEENGVAAEASSRARLASAFSKFLSSYHSASYAIDALPHTKMLSELRRKVESERDAAFSHIREDLQIEKEFLLRELVARGGTDEEGAQMKREIEVELIHLRHLAAVAQTALARLSAQPPPLDPVESMQLDIVEKEARDVINLA
jgi:hypothetical protein